MWLDCEPALGSRTLLCVCVQQETAAIWIVRIYLFIFLKKKNHFVSEEGQNNSAESRWAVIRLWFTGAVLEIECDNANGIEECLRR